MQEAAHDGPDGKGSHDTHDYEAGQTEGVVGEDAEVLKEDGESGEG